MHEMYRASLIAFFRPCLVQSKAGTACSLAEPRTCARSSRGSAKARRRANLPRSAVRRHWISAPVLNPRACAPAGEGRRGQGDEAHVRRHPVHRRGPLCRRHAQPARRPVRGPGACRSHGVKCALARACVFGACAPILPASYQRPMDLGQNGFVAQRLDSPWCSVPRKSLCGARCGSTDPSAAPIQRATDKRWSCITALSPFFPHLRPVAAAQVLSQKPRALILSVDPAPALALPGVVDYVDHKASF
jgi:hypothetical protein